MMKKPTEFDKQVLRYFVYNHTGGVQHIWNDGWIHWKDLYEAEKELLYYLRKSRILADMKEKYGTIRLYYLSAYNGTLKSLLQPSIKFGFDWYPDIFFLRRKWEPKCAIIPHCLVSAVNGFKMGLYGFIWNGVKPVVNRVLSVLSYIDYFIAYPHLPFYNECVIHEENSKHPVLYRIDRWIRSNVRFIPKRFIGWVQQRQVQVINEGYQKVCLKYPYLVHELVSHCDLYKCIKPYGPYVLNGEDVWNQHWESI